MAGPVLNPSGLNDERNLSKLGGTPGSIIEQVIKVAQVLGQYGLATVIFAFPVVLGCYGLYFLSLAVSTPQLNTGRMVVGMFATVFGPGLTIVLLLIFTRLNLWEKLLPKAEPKTHAKAA
jgi:hypothetical protein